MRANGKAWDKDSWKKPIASAVKAGELPAGTTAYTLRHSTITDLVSAGLPLLTIAQISGTSAEMIERHYGHLASDAAMKALGELALVTSPQSDDVLPEKEQEEIVEAKEHLFWGRRPIRLGR